MHKSSSKAEDMLLNNLCDTYRENNRINVDAYKTLDVKRGLRNSNGTGVLAGFTLIGNAHGYVMNEGEKTPAPGALSYRGIDLNELIEGYMGEGRFGFEECAYLILMGKLPTRAEYDCFVGLIGQMRTFPENFSEDMILKAPSPDVMNKLGRATLALYSYDENPDDGSLENLLYQGMLLLSRFPGIISHAYQVKKHYYEQRSLLLRNPSAEYSTAENILRLIRGNAKYTEEEARLLDLCLVIHAEHGGGNNSAFSCRVLASSGTDIYSAVSAAVGSLKGPKHGGANIKVTEMFENIKQNVSNWRSDDEVSAYLTRILKKEVHDKSGLIYGMGHAIYTLSDPRAVILKKYARALAERNQFIEEFELYERVERLTPGIFGAMRGEDRAMCANVDMYSGLVYRMLNIPQDLFTPIFAVSRVVGWIAHYIEERIYGGKIIRPAYKAISKPRGFVKMEDR